MNDKIYLTFAQNPKKLLLLDGFGALASIFFLSVILAPFEIEFGMPAHILYKLSLLALMYGIYSFSCAFFVKKSWPVFIQVIVVANTLYCLLTVGLVIHFYQALNELSITYFILEMAVILGLAFIEQKTIQQIRKNKV